MNMQKYQGLYEWFESIGKNENNTFMAVHPNDIYNIKHGLQNLAGEKFCLFSAHNLI